jgi:alanine racemase
LSHLPEPPEPTLRLSIDTDALAGNWRVLDRMSGSASAGAAVKADCYGLGVGACVPALRDAGAGLFFVAHWSEVPALLAHVNPAQIAVLHGPLTRAEAEYAAALGVTPVINSQAQARLWLEAGRGAPCHLMIDTGINRLGVSPAELTEPAIAALDVDILLSHLAAADEDSFDNARQLDLFRRCIPAIAHKRVSLANSAGIALGEMFAFDVTRPGLALYGGVPRPELAREIRPVARIEAAILQAKTVSAGEKVGYNGEYTAPSPTRIATVSIGYADGFLRARGPGTALTLGEARLPVIGKVSMDMIVVDCAEAPDCGPGDWLEVPFLLPDAARQSSLSQYELLTTLGRRLGRAPR